MKKTAKTKTTATTKQKDTTKPNETTTKQIEPRSLYGFQLILKDSIYQEADL